MTIVRTCWGSNYPVLSPGAQGVEAQTCVAEESQLYKPNNQEINILKYSKVISAPCCCLLGYHLCMARCLNMPTVFYEQFLMIILIGYNLQPMC